MSAWAVMGVAPRVGPGAGDPDAMEVDPPDETTLVQAREHPPSSPLKRSPRRSPTRAAARTPPRTPGGNGALRQQPGDGAFRRRAIHVHVDHERVLPVWYATCAWMACVIGYHVGYPYLGAAMRMQTVVDPWGILCGVRVVYLLVFTWLPWHIPSGIVSPVSWSRYRGIRWQAVGRLPQRIIEVDEMDLAYHLGYFHLVLGCAMYAYHCVMEYREAVFEAVMFVSFCVACVAFLALEALVSIPKKPAPYRLYREYEEGVPITIPPPMTMEVVANDLAIRQAVSARYESCVGFGLALVATPVYVLLYPHLEALWSDDDAVTAGALTFLSRASFAVLWGWGLGRVVTLYHGSPVYQALLHLWMRLKRASNPRGGRASNLELFEWCWFVAAYCGILAYLAVAITFTCTSWDLWSEYVSYPVAVGGWSVVGIGVLRSALHDHSHRRPSEDW